MRKMKYPAGIRLPEIAKSASGKRTVNHDDRKKKKSPRNITRMPLMRVPLYPNFATHLDPTPPAIGYARNHEKVINVAIVLVNPPALLRKASLRGPWNWVFAVVRKPTMKNRNTMVMNGPR
jgi:hypothetical protein